MKKIVALVLVMIMLCSAIPVLGEGPVTARDTLTMAVGMIPTTLDKFTSITDVGLMITYLVGESLLKFEKDENGEFYFTTEGAITEAYEWDEDQLGITFHIRKGIQCTDGNELNARDVEFCISRYNGYAMWYNVNFEQSRAIDDYTFYLKLNSYDSLSFHDMMWAAMFSKEAYEACGDEATFFAENYISCGAYYIDSWNLGDSIVLKRNPNYFGDALRDGMYAIDTIVMRVVSEPSVAMMELETGGVDLVYSPSFISFNSVLNGDYGEEFTAFQSTGAGQDQLFINMASDLMQDYDLRYAIYSAINREEISTGIFRGYGVQAYTISVPTHEGLTIYDAETWPIKYDPEKAKSILEEKGYGDLSLRLITASGDQYQEGTAEVIANQLSQVGIEVKITTYDAATASDIATNAPEEWELYLGQEGNLSPDPIGNEIAVGGTATNCNIADLPTAHYQEVYDLGVQQMDELDMEKRIAITKKLEKLYWDELLWYIPLQNRTMMTIMTSALTGVDRMVFLMDFRDAVFTR